jgi:hypothetical protein
MKVQRYNGSEFMFVKEVRDVNVQKQQLEEKIRAADELSNLMLENAARREIVDYIIEKNANFYQCQYQDVAVAAWARIEDVVSVSCSSKI